MSSAIDSATLRATGLVLREDVESDPSAAPAATGTAIELRSGRAQQLRLVGDLVTLAMMTDLRTDQHGRPLSEERKRRDVMARIIMDPRDPTKPLYVYASLELGPEDITGKGIGQMYRTFVPFEVPSPDGSTIEVHGVPHLIADGVGGRIMYGNPIRTVDGEGKETVTVKMCEHLCIVMRPLPGASLYKLLPFGLARPVNIRTWNQIAKQLVEQGLPTFEVIPHNLFARERIKFITFKPAGLFRYWLDGDKERLQKLRSDAKQALTSGDPKAIEAADKLVAEFQPSGPWHYGKVDGMSTVVRGLESNIPNFDDPETFSFTRPHVFYVQQEESRLGLVHVGPFGEAKLVKGSMNGLSSIVISPFEALGKSPHEVDKRSVSDVAYMLANSDPGMGNLLWAYAVKYEYLDALETRTDVIQEVLSGLAQMVISRAREEFDIIRTELSRKLIWASPPELEDMLAGQTAQTVYWRRGGADVLAAWMAEKVEGGQFDWSSTLHRLVRQDILANSLSLRGEGIPEVPNFTTTVRQAPRQPPQAKVKSASAPAPTDKPTEPEPPATKPVKPPRPPRGSRKAKPPTAQTDVN